VIDDHTPPPDDATAWVICPSCRGTGYARTGAPPRPRPCDHCDRPGVITYRAMWLCAECLPDALAVFHESSS
jgi:DnaJ-class molecular chaperone